MQTRHRALPARRQRWRQRTGRRRSYDRVVILEGRDARLSYFVAGDGPPVTLLHGFTQSGRSWREVIAKMPEGWRWIVPDLRGHGETQTPPGRPGAVDARAEDLVPLRNEVGLRQTHHAGGS